jgi:hypothetical protein
MMRPISAIIIVTLPLAEDLDVTSLLSIIMALIAFTTIWESVTGLMRGACFWEKWENTKYPENPRSMTTSSGAHVDSEKNIRESETDRNGEA